MYLYRCCMNSVLKTVNKYTNLHFKLICLEIYDIFFEVSTYTWPWCADESNTKIPNNKKYGTDITARFNAIFNVPSVAYIPLIRSAGLLTKLCLNMISNCDRSSAAGYGWWQGIHQAKTAKMVRSQRGR